MANNNMLRSSRFVGLESLSLLLFLLTAEKNTAAFSTIAAFTQTKNTIYRIRSTSKDIRLLGSTSNIDSWSKSITTIDSRYGIQNRVRAVLDKAKQKTGINNINSEPSRLLLLDETTIYRPSSRISSSFYLHEDSFLEEEPAQDDAALYYQLSQTSVDSKALTTKDNSYLKAVSESLPFVLPLLTEDQERRLSNGERVQQQSTMSREGSGYVVMDIKAPEYIIWEALLDFEAYPENIGTVRSMQMFTNTHMKQSYVAEKPLLPGECKESLHYGQGSITRASFVLSKFRLNIAAVHKYVPHPDGHYMEFTLDKACKNVVLKDAKGIWHTQQRIDEVSGQYITRVWLLCELRVSSLLPQFIVDYAARKAMPRATNWLAPTVERLRKEFE